MSHCARCNLYSFLYKCVGCYGPASHGVAGLAMPGLSTLLCGIIDTWGGGYMGFATPLFYVFPPIILYHFTPCGTRDV